MLPSIVSLHGCYTVVLIKKIQKKIKKKFKIQKKCSRLKVVFESPKISTMCYLFRYLSQDSLPGTNQIFK